MVRASEKRGGGGPRQTKQKFSPSRQASCSQPFGRRALEARRAPPHPTRNQLANDASGAYGKPRRKGARAPVAAPLNEWCRTTTSKQTELAHTNSTQNKCPGSMSCRRLRTTTRRTAIRGPRWRRRLPHNGRCEHRVAKTRGISSRAATEPPFAGTAQKRATIAVGPVLRPPFWLPRDETLTTANNLAPVSGTPAAQPPPLTISSGTGHTPGWPRHLERPRRTCRREQGA